MDGWLREMFFTVKKVFCKFVQKHVPKQCSHDIEIIEAKINI